MSEKTLLLGTLIFVEVISNQWQKTNSLTEINRLLKIKA